MRRMRIIEEEREEDLQDEDRGHHEEMTMMWRSAVMTDLVSLLGPPGYAVTPPPMTAVRKLALSMGAAISVGRLSRRFRRFCLLVIFQASTSAALVVSIVAIVAIVGTLFARSGRLTGLIPLCVSLTTQTSHIKGRAGLPSCGGARIDSRGPAPRRTPFNGLRSVCVIFS